MIGEQPESRYRFAIEQPRDYLSTTTDTRSTPPAAPGRTSTTGKRSAARQQVNPLMASSPMTAPEPQGFAHSQNQLTGQTD
jgi:hypothetical protein